MSRRSQISLQLYSVRALLEGDFHGTLAAVAGLGFRQVELYDFVDRAPEYADVMAANHLSARSAHASLLGPTDADASFAAAATLGVEVVIEPCVAERFWTSEDAVRRTATGLNDLVPQANDAGLRVGYHNHDWEFRHFIGQRHAYELFADMLHPDVVLEVDTYWASTGGANVAELLERLGERAAFLHLKDGPLNWELQRQTALGSGALPLTSILAAAPHAQYVVEFDDYPGDVMVGIAQSLHVLRERGITP